MSAPATRGAARQPRHDASLVASTFARTRLAREADRVRLEARRTQALGRLLDGPLASFDYYREALARVPPGASVSERLAALPVVDKGTVLGQFERFNRLGWTLERAREAARRGGAHRTTAHEATIRAGLSSGTSGPPAVFLTSARERARWAGSVLARGLSSASLRQALTPWAAPLRIALVLRANDALYERVGGRRIRFRFVDLAAPFEVRVDALARLDPHVLVAPPSALGALARAALEGWLPIRPRQVIGVAEVLEADDARDVRAAWGVEPGQLYQCTEGFLGSSCPHGRVHLHEGHVIVEPEWLDAARERFVPIVTDLARETQAIVRYRLDDVLRVAPEPCPCGRATLALAAIEGRLDDVLELRDAHGRHHPLFPDAIRGAMAALDPAPRDWRLEQTGSTWTVRLAGTVVDDPRSPLPNAVTRALERLCTRLALLPPAIHHAPWVEPAPGTKRRRIRRLEAPSVDDRRTGSAVHRAPEADAFPSGTSAP